MSRKDETPGRQSSAMSAGGPWGAKEEEVRPRPEWDEPHNPWTPPHGEADHGPGSGPSAFDELMRRARGSFGGNLPGRPDRTHVWLAVAGGIVLLWLGLTSLHSIGETERGLVSRLGSYSRTLGPGMNLTLPAPFETVKIVETGALHSFTVSAAGGGENLLLTGDQDLLNLAYSVNWTISDARKFAFGLADPDKTVHDTALSTMRAVIAGVRLDGGTLPDRKAIEQRVQDRMQSILDGYGAGIHIQDVVINSADAPRAIAPALEAVSAARKASEAYIQAAKEYKVDKAASAQREVADFDALYAQYKIAPEVTKRRFYYETVETVLKGANKTVVDAHGVTLQLPRGSGVPRLAPPPAGGGGK